VGAAWNDARRGEFATRLWQKDATLWSADPAHQKVAANRLGWLDLPAGMRGEVAGLEAFVAEIRAEGFTHAVLLGMGGSSLAPEVMRRMLGVAPGFLELTVLDNTSPAAVRAVTVAHDPRRTVFLVSSKSGGTIEVASFEKHFFEWVRAARGDGAGRAFVAITDPGSPLARRAAERGYRRVFLNPPDVGGRYSALSLFGLLPAALLGASPTALLESAARELDEARRDPGGGAAVAFGFAVGEAALAGQDKLTLAFGPRWAPFGAWVEQLVAESTGKDGHGVVPVDGEETGPAALARADRAFVATPDLAPALGRQIAHREGPAWLLDLESPRDLGAAFLRWEIATAAAAAVLGVDPFDEPNVSEAKQATQAVLDRALAEGHFPTESPLAHGSGWELYAAGPAEPALRATGARDPRSALAALLALARPGDYLALLAYLHATATVDQALQHVRVAAAGDSGLASTLGIGPRFLHSTGQLHKGGPDRGLFLQITADEGPDVPIPGEPYSFGMLRRAQAAGDYEVLARHGRRVARLHFEGDVTAALGRLAGL
jgi:transaldolase / glucose-6-phosphate isomerase